MNWIKKYLSYLYPIPDRKAYSPINGTIEINWNNGERVIDTKSANYSYGSLQRLLKFGLSKIDTDFWNNCNNILVLGVAGGSVIKTLHKDFKFKGNIVGVEIDPMLIQWLNKEFNIETNQSTLIIEADAKTFLETTNHNFDLIIIDIFIDTDMPDFLFSEHFIDNCFRIVNSSGYLLFNTIFKNNSDRERNNNYYNYINKKTTSIKRLDNLDGFNEIFVIKK